MLARRTQEQRSGWRGAELAALRQRAPRGVERAAAHAVKRAAQKI
jgi:hypothetical protein